MLDDYRKQGARRPEALARSAPYCPPDRHFGSRSSQPLADPRPRRRPRHVAVFVIWGPLMIGCTYYVMAEELPGWVLLASIPYGLGVTTVLFGKHLDKLDFDASKGIRTMPIVLGESLARQVTIALSALMYVSTAAL